MVDRISGRECDIADITNGLQLGREDVLRGLGNFLNVDRPSITALTA